MRKTNLITKSLSLTLAGVFLAQAALADAGASDLWNARRRALSGNARNVQMASLPAAAARANQLLQAMPPPAIRAIAAGPITLPPGTGKGSAAETIMASLPANVGTVREVHVPKGPSERTILLIQDVHLNPEAQGNIGAAVNALVEKGAVKVVGLEGAFSDINLDSLRSFPSPDISRSVADYLLKENRISGPIHAGLTGKLAATFVGVDDSGHYGANVAAYRISASRQKDYAERIRAKKVELTARKAVVFNKDLLVFDRRREDYREGRRKVGDYLKFLTAAPRRTTPAIEKFLKALALEEDMNFPRVERERTAMMQKLVTSLSDAETGDLLRLSLAFRSGDLGPAAFYGQLRTLCERNNVPLAQWPAVDAYVRYVVLSDSIRIEDLFAELETLETEATASLARTPEEKALAQQFESLHLSEKLVGFALSPREWDAYKRLPPSDTLAALDLKSFESFYREAEARNDALITNLVAAMKAGHTSTGVLVAGGFHAAGIQERLRRENVSSLTFVPRITKVDLAEGSGYLSVFTQEKAPLEKLFDGEKLFLASNPIAPASRHLQAVLNVATGLFRKIGTVAGYQTWLNSQPSPVKASIQSASASAARSEMSMELDLGGAQESLTVDYAGDRIAESRVDISASKTSSFRALTQRVLGTGMTYYRNFTRVVSPALETPIFAILFIGVRLSLEMAGISGVTSDLVALLATAVLITLTHAKANGRWSPSALGQYMVGSILLVAPFAVSSAFVTLVALQPLSLLAIIAIGVASVASYSMHYGINGSGALLPMSVGDRSALVQAFLTEKDPTLREELATRLSGEFRGGMALVTALYPGRARDIQRLLPNLNRMANKGLAHSVFAHPGEIGPLLKVLDGIHASMDEFEYERMLEVYQTLDDIPRFINFTKTRNVFIQEGGYKLDFPLFPGDESTPEEPYVIRASMEAQKPELKAKMNEKFDHFDALIDANFAALEAIKKNSTGMTPKTARFLLEEVEKMVSNYEFLNANGWQADQTAAIRAAFNKMRDELNELISAPGQTDSEALPHEVIARFTQFESGKPPVADMKNLHTFINHVHQQSFSALNRSVSSERQWGESQGTAGIVGGSKKGDLIGLSLINLSKNDPFENGIVHNRTLARIIEGIRKNVYNAANGLIIVRDDKVWIHCQIGDHTAEVFVDLSPPDEGGMLRVRYTESEGGVGNRLRIQMLQNAMMKMGMAANTEDNFHLEAIIDKDHGAVSSKQMELALETSLRAIYYSFNLDQILSWSYRENGDDEASHQAVVSQMVDLLVGEGEIPYFKAIEEAAFEPGGRPSTVLDEARYQREDKEGPANRLRRTLNTKLRGLDLPEIPEGVPFGQTTVDRYFNAAISEALGRGQLRPFGNGMLEPNPAYRPTADLAVAVKNSEGTALETAALLDGVNLGALNFQTIGAVGRLLAQRAQIRLANGNWVLVDRMIHPINGRTYFAVAHEMLASGTAELLAPIEVAAALEIPEEKARPLLGQLSDAQKDAARALRDAKPDEVPPVAGEYAGGIAASPGRSGVVTGRITFNPNYHLQDGPESQGRIFMAPYTTPDELGAITAARAILTTGGGILSHASITAAEHGLASVIVAGAEWVEEGGEKFVRVTVLRPGPAKPNADGVYVSGILSVETLVIREGDVVTVDGAKGEITVQPQGARSLVREALQELSKPTAANSGFLTNWLLALTEKLPEPDVESLLAFLFSQAAYDRGMAGPARTELMAAIAATAARLTPPARARVEGLRGRLTARLRNDITDALSALQAGVRSAASVRTLDALLSRVSDLTTEAITTALRLGLDVTVFQTIEKGLPPLVGQVENARVRARSELIGQARALKERIDATAVDEQDLPGDLSEVRRVLAAARGLGLQIDLLLDLSALRALEQRLTSERAQQVAALAGKTSFTLDQIDDDFVSLVGGKSAKLGAILRVVRAEGGTVPEGLAVATSAFQKFLNENEPVKIGLARVAAAMDQVLSREMPDAEREARINELAQEARALILSGRFDETSGVGAEIMNAVTQAGLDKELLAVRSSAVQEDTGNAAFAGVAETYLNVDRDHLLEKGKENWMSFWMPRGVMYRAGESIAQVDVAPAVLNQKMVDADVAGVMFTINPANGHDDVVINSAYGLGEGVVSGIVQADKFTARKSDGQQTELAVRGSKRVKVVRKANGTGTEAVSVPAEARRGLSLTPDQVTRLTKMGAALERHFGFPVDIEFAIKNNQIYILQCRPITTSRRRDADLVGRGRNKTQINPRLTATSYNTSASIFETKAQALNMAADRLKLAANDARANGKGLLGAALSTTSFLLRSLYGLYTVVLVNWETLFQAPVIVALLMVSSPTLAIPLAIALAVGMAPLFAVAHPGLPGESSQETASRRRVLALVGLVLGLSIIPGFFFGMGSGAIIIPMILHSLYNGTVLALRKFGFRLPLASITEREKPDDSRRNSERVNAVADRVLAVLPGLPVAQRTALRTAIQNSIINRLGRPEDLRLRDLDRNGVAPGTPSTTSDVARELLNTIDAVLAGTRAESGSESISVLLGAQEALRDLSKVQRLDDRLRLDESSFVQVVTESESFVDQTANAAAAFLRSDKAATGTLILTSVGDATHAALLKALDRKGIQPGKNVIIQLAGKNELTADGRLNLVAAAYRALSGGVSTGLSAAEAGRLAERLQGTRHFTHDPARVALDADAVLALLEGAGAQLDRARLKTFLEDTARVLQLLDQLVLPVKILGGDAQVRIARLISQQA